MSTRLKKVAVTAAAVVAATAGVAIAAPGSAFAASYNGVCGSSYGVIDAMSLPGEGTVYLTYSSSTGKNCVVTIRDNPGSRLYMAARVSLAGDPWITDDGNFTTYAGPVYVHAPNACIDWGGEIDGVYEYEFNSHCG